MRMGKYWNEASIHLETRNRIEKIINAEFDENIRNRVREKSINLSSIHHFKGLPLWLVSYIVYDRHAEDSNIEKWKTPTVTPERYLSATTKAAADKRKCNTIFNKNVII